MVNEKTMPAAARLADFHARLHAWYAAHGRRALPWRNTQDPYAIYVSEVMLQQTQVSTVLERYYFPFLERFPTVEALASAGREEVLKAWQGLGYYSRAANLHKAAQGCKGGLPRDVETLIALPGVGRNTAHAVAAFAYHLPVPVMEANVKRVIHRIFALRSSSGAVAHQTLWECAHALLDAAEPFDYNQAMMDIGAMVCTRRAPKCGECPANAICAGKASPESYPAKRAAKKTRVRQRAIFVLRDANGRIYAEPRQERFLQGMYRFVEADYSPRKRGSITDVEKIPLKELFHALGLKWLPACAGDKIGHVTQIYSHFTLEAEVYVVWLAGPKPQGEGWFTLEELRRLPHSKAEEKILAMLAEFPSAPAHPPGR